MYLYLNISLFYLFILPYAQLFRKVRIILNLNFLFDFDFDLDFELDFYFDFLLLA
jgi:hypothetical protein